MTDTGPAIVIPPKVSRFSRMRGWLPPWPDARGWVIFGFFFLEHELMHMIGDDGTLLANSAFMQFAGMITTGGVLLIASNMFGGTKAGAEMNARVGDALTNLAGSKDGK